MSAVIAEHATNLNVSHCSSEDLKKEVKELTTGLQIYQRAVRAYRYKYGKDEEALTKIEAIREARRIFRIGVRMVNRVEQFIKSGRMKKVQKNWCEEVCHCIKELSKIDGLGHIRAAELIDAGINTIDDLYCNTDKLTRQQLIGLEHFHDFNLKIPIKEAEEIVDIIKRQVVHLNQNFSVYLCGSFRRGHFSDDKIDCIIKTPKSDCELPVDETLKKIVVRLKNSGLITDIICLGDYKFSGACHLSPQSPVRRIYLRLTPPSHFPFALLFHTGPRTFIEKLLKSAKHEGLTLSEEYALHKNTPNGNLGETIPVLTEEEIFEHLKMSYVVPQDRK